MKRSSTAEERRWRPGHSEIEAYVRTGAKHQFTIDELHELVVDNFAGGGGASSGIADAIGRSPDIAINHDPAAIAMHEANHPDTKHYTESVWDIDPLEVTQGRPVGLAWFSPDCKHFSKAKGGKPVSKKIRGLAWVILKWAALVRPRCIMGENVEEFVTWGPLDDDGYPIKGRAGETFAAFIACLTTGLAADHPAWDEIREVLGPDFPYEMLERGLGYRAEWKELKACDFGAPTIRKRLFLVIRCDGRPIVWPAPTHGDPQSAAVKAGKLKPWRTAAEIIDWSIPCPSIFERKKPLKENTLRRIARGIQRFVIDNPNPFVIRLNYPSSPQRERMADEPVQTMTAKNDLALVNPFVVPVTHQGSDRVASLEVPFPTVTGANRGEHALVSATVAPYVVRIGQTGYGADRMQYSTEQPLTTITSKAEHLLVAPVLGVNTTGHPGSSPDEPLKTVTTGGHHMLIAPVIDRQFTKSTANKADTPLGTVTAAVGGKSNLVSAFLAQYHSETESHHARGQTVDRPVLTVDAANRYGLVTSNLVKLRGTCADGQSVTEPVPTVTAGGLHVGEVRAFLLKYYGASDNGQVLDDPLHTVTSKDRFGLVTVEGQEYEIVDIGMRMLEPRELYDAQGFPADYIIDIDWGNGKHYSKKDQVARCGNAVPPAFSRALVEANLPEMCAHRAAVAGD